MNAQLIIDKPVADVIYVYKNSKGPQIDPCGTPHSVLAVLEYLFLLFTRKLLSEKVLLKPLYCVSDLKTL